MTTATPSQDTPITALLDRARRYCSAAEQCEDAVRQKLAAWGATADEADTIVDRLCEDGYLDNGRFARTYCESKLFVQHWGRQKVRYHLRLKRLPDSAVNAALASVDEERYTGMLLQLAIKKQAELQRSTPDGQQQRLKLMAFLASRGFTATEINQVITNIKSNP